MNSTRLGELRNTLLQLGFKAEAHGATEYAEDWYIRPVSGAGGTRHVRIVIHIEDGTRVEAHHLDRHHVAEWSAAFTGETPVHVIRAAACAMTSA